MNEMMRDALELGTRELGSLVTLKRIAGNGVMTYPGVQIENSMH